MKNLVIQRESILFLLQRNLKMKFTALFLIVTLFQTHANGPSTSEDVRVTINLKNVSLEKVLNRIESITDFKFVYKDDDVNYNKRVSVKANKKPLIKVLDQLFYDTDIKYSVSNKQIVLKPRPIIEPVKVETPKPVEQTKFQVTGTVFDEYGQPLPGANVLEKGTTNGAQTDFDGKFTIRVNNENATLVVSYLGFDPKEVPVNGQANVQITLKENLAELDEVVVVGYGTQKKETVVGSVTQAKGEEILRAGSVATVSEALTGIMPGVSTQQAAGQPGSTASTILIRGQSTFGGSGNQPLFIVDGVERDFNDLDPNEIESISVLKDASATAVFGVKAANGVVVVTTKRGKAGETKVNFFSSWGLKEPTMDTDYYADFATTLEAYNEAAMNDRAYGLLYSQSEIDMWRDPNRDRDFYSYTTWIEELLKTGVNSQYNVNVSGGNDFVTYFSSLGYQFDGDIFDFEKQKDFDPRTYQRKFTWRSNLDFNFSKSTKFKVGLSGNFKTINKNSLTRLTNNGITTGGGNTFARIWQTPLIGPQPILPDGRLTTEEGAVVNPNFYKGEREGQWRDRSTTLYTDFTLVQNLTKDLRVQGRLSYNYFQEYGNNNGLIRQNVLYYYPNEDLTGFIQDGDPDAIAGPPTVNAENITGSSNSLYYELRVNYDKSFGDHDIGAMGLFSRRRAQSGTNFPRFEESWVGRATYAYKSKYLLEFNGAYNGNENWAPGLRYGFFPSLAGGWVVSREDWFKENVKFMNFLKLRYSYGEIGSDKGIGNNRFLYISQYDGRSGGTAQLFFGDPLINYGNLFLEGRPAVPGNTWETAVKQDLAVEMGLFNNKLQSTIEFFQENRKDILIQRNTVAPWFGAVTPFANIGETKNHGVDIELRWNHKVSENFEYFLRGNMSISESRIVAQDDAPSTAPQQRNEGKPIGWTAGLLNDGIYQSWDEVYNSPTSGYAPDDTLIPGNLSYVDYNADGIISDLDRVPINNPQFATKTFAFTVGFKYKGVSVNALFNGMWDISKNLAESYMYEWAGAGMLGFQLLNNEQRDAWSFDNPDGVHPALRTQNTGHDRPLSTYTNRAADFLRFKTLEVKYQLGKKAKDAIGFFDSFEIFVNGNNLATWSDLPSHFDPEQNQLIVYPITKRYNLGVRLSF
ncbi:TonB-dependent receptor [Seonamhaeicola marinus]|uniref:TonB-dependent receptor n=2 Tax=Seonamhaeicola marinus TaxID=1912246 RepID=A0A5D0IMA2_9FLAO|nr:TonB-dependent receptor [Seonamhaeicola marinus]